MFDKKLLKLLKSCHLQGGLVHKYTRGTGLVRFLTK